MKKERITYKTNEDIWKIKRELKAKGYTQTTDAYWVQIFENANENKIIIAERN